ncbi:MAG: hypothetical protein QF384_03595 [Alphaproteobacteria bacterium]|jgi:hypothetical protein|nr:hypothetical protein [Alphaproteobacteria bacterium]MDP6872751.1 hypothetical protein [Alphaproteobacteria bacterium]
MTLRNLVLAMVLGPAVALAFAHAAGPAMAMPYNMDESCLASDELSSYLDRAYGEDRIASAELDNGHQVELFASRQGSWTLVELIPDGHGCIHAYGQRMKIDGAEDPARRSPS